MTGPALDEQCTQFGIEQHPVHLGVEKVLPSFFSDSSALVAAIRGMDQNRDPPSQTVFFNKELNF